MLEPNTTLQNRYRIVRKLGQGGMGAIYEAIDSRVSSVVALKETLIGSSSALKEAFQREAALLANLRHPLLPKVMDYFGEGDGEFLVMEFITGDDLLELLAKHERPLPQQQVLQWAIELLKLLEYLHTHEPSILHRDIKPANIKTTANGEIFLLDFGLAKGSTGQMLTVETEKSVPGYTPVYSPLEQILGQGTDQRSDLYALGATLYHLLTGQPPVSAPARFNAIENSQPDPLKPANQVNIDIAPEVDSCILKAMALRQRDRTGNARKMRAELEHAAELIASREMARKAEQDLFDTAPERDSSKPIVVDDNVQFTVYAPEQIKPEKSYSLLAFAHLARRRDDAAPGEPDPLEEVKNQASRVLGEQREDYRNTKDSSSQAVPRGGQLTFVPVVRGLTFNPPTRSFTWEKSVHREEFDVRASPEVDGEMLRGSMTVFLGSVVIADVGLTIAVDSQASPAKERISLDQGRSARCVKQVYASYSHKDEQVVAELAQVAPLFGSRFIMDRTHLEPGEDRVEGVQRLIRDADVFQLFWSTNSMRSDDTVREIKYAAKLGRTGFILPTYWEEPMPRSPTEQLPPPEIERLQFHRIYPGAIEQAAFGQKKTRLVIFGPAGAEIYIDDQREGSIGSSGRVVLTGLTIGQHLLRVTRTGDADDERVIEIIDGEEQNFQSNLTSRKTTDLALGRDSTANHQPRQSSTPLSDDRPTAELAPPTQIISPPVPSSWESSRAETSQFDIAVCPTCNMRYAAGTVFCASCGTSLIKFDNQTRNQEAAFSTAAQTTLAPQNLPPAATQDFHAPQVAKRRSMIPIYAGAAAMVLFVMVLVPVWLMTTLSTSPSESINANVSSGGNPTTANTNTTANANTGFEVAPDVTFTRLDGTAIPLRQFRGQVVLLNFWATSSELSRNQMSALNEIQRSLVGRGVSVIGVSSDDVAEKVRAFQKENPSDYLLVIGSREVQSQIPATTLPTTYIIDRRGRIRKRFIGVQSRKALETAILPLINEPS